jgi:RNA polymerase sigma-70 factor (ECF subfamily)
LLDERQLMQETGATRESRFDSLVERQAKFVFRVAFSVLRNPESAEDVVQETFLKLYRNRAWETMENERAFLARVAWRMAVERIPKKRREHAAFREPVSEDANPEETLLSSDWIGGVLRLVDALPEEFRQVLALSGIEGLNSREIAEVTGIPEGTVRRRLQRARQLVKQKLENVGRSPCGK